jgi:hypothetical protein
LRVRASALAGQPEIGACDGSSAKRELGGQEALGYLMQVDLEHFFEILSSTLDA